MIASNSAVALRWKNSASKMNSLTRSRLKVVAQAAVAETVVVEAAAVVAIADVAEEVAAADNVKAPVEADVVAVAVEEAEAAVVIATRLRNRSKQFKRPAFVGRFFVQ